MITKLAFLTRILPGLFRRLPMVTSAGYTMPRERFFFFGVSFSALLHAAVLFGFNPPKPPPPNGDIAERPGCIIAFNYTPEEPPPPAPEPDVSKPDPNTKEVASGEDYTRLSNLIAHPGTIDFGLAPEKLDLGKMPISGEIRWAPPSNPPGPGVGKNRTPIFNRDELDKVPVVTNRIAPRYPFEMKHEGRSGTVVLRFVVDSRGDVTDVEVVSSPHADFSKAAVEAMLRWKFRPGVKDFKKVNTRMEMPMAFSLEKSS